MNLENVKLSFPNLLFDKKKDTCWCLTNELKLKILECKNVCEKTKNACVFMDYTTYSQIQQSIKRDSIRCNSGHTVYSYKYIHSYEEQSKIF